MKDAATIALEALGHARVPSTRCPARYKEAEHLPGSGPRNPPVWCDLQAGHEGPHRHVTGHHSAIMNREHLIEMKPLPDVCQKCGTKWPCKDAEAVINSFAESAHQPSVSAFLSGMDIKETKAWWDEICIAGTMTPEEASTLVRTVDDLIAEVERLTTSSKAWVLQAKGYGKVIDLLDGDELRQLEQAIAYSGARSDIECWCHGINYSGANSGTWYDSESPESDEEKEMVGAAIRYLELRGLLKRHPDNPNLVKPLDVEEVAKCAEK